MVAFCVCGVYLSVGLAILIFGLIDLDATGLRVGTDNMLGFFQKDVPEKRLEACDRYLTSLERALKSERLLSERLATSKSTNVTLLSHFLWCEVIGGLSPRALSARPCSRRNKASNRACKF